MVVLADAKEEGEEGATPEEAAYAIQKGKFFEWDLGYARGEKDDIAHTKRDEASDDVGKSSPAIIEVLDVIQFFLSNNLGKIAVLHDRGPQSSSYSKIYPA